MRREFQHLNRGVWVRERALVTQPLPLLTRRQQRSLHTNVDDGNHHQRTYMQQEPRMLCRHAECVQMPMRSHAGRDATHLGLGGAAAEATPACQAERPACVSPPLCAELPPLRQDSAKVPEHAAILGGPLGSGRVAAVPQLNPVRASEARRILAGRRARRERCANGASENRGGERRAEVRGQSGSASGLWSAGKGRAAATVRLHGTLARA